MTLPDPESPPTPSCPCQGRLDVPSPWSAGFHDGSHGHRRGTSDYYAEHEEGPEDARTYGDAYDYGAEIRRNAGLHNPLEPRMQLPDPETCRRLARDVAPRWIWFAGMLTHRYGRVREQTSIAWTTQKVLRRLVIDNPNAERFDGFDGAPDAAPVPAAALPDLRDPLTAAGALLVARQVWAPSCRVIWAWLSTCEGWIVTDGYGHRLGGGRTELEATIAAILAAPEKP